MLSGLSKRASDSAALLRAEQATASAKAKELQALKAKHAQLEAEKASLLSQVRA